jgi:hypothetical protein
MTLRELDALVAEKVLGHTPDPTRCDQCYWPLREREEDGCVKDNCSQRPLPEKRSPRPYSSDIAAAWEVVERLRQQHCCTKIYSDHDLSYECVLIRDRNDPHKPSDGIWGLAATAPLAICLAALASVGITVNQTEVSDASRT